MAGEELIQPSAARPACTPATPRCLFWEWGPEAVRPACCTEHLKDLVFFTADLLTREGIAFWADFGTLLGAVREGAIIAFDYDADFSVYARDRERIAALAPEFAARGHELEVREDHIWRIFLSPANRNHLDLFPFYPEGGELRLPGPYAGRSAFPAFWAERLAPVRLYGRELPAPAPAEEFLIRYRYGPGYRSPMRHYAAPFDPGFRAVIRHLERKGRGTP